MQVKLKRLNDKAILPQWNNKSAGCDLSSTEFYILKPGERHLFKTGLAIAIPTLEMHELDKDGKVVRKIIRNNGLYGRIAPRSGLAYKHGIDVMAGVIDEDYRGEIGVILINLGQEDKTIMVGDKIAQLIFETYTRVDFEESETLEDTERGVGGFGSTGT